MLRIALQRALVTFLATDGDRQTHAARRVSARAGKMSGRIAPSGNTAQKSPWSQRNEADRNAATKFLYCSR
jgi:hypothetical protein